ncbi:MAG TPA: alpha/beta hydrolase [Hyphomonadaceae bacterium]|jgi:pimeloyl-ACP methyl ester carboxylesterase|nr:alpha/beta hydrolase [Hyphomonadaceae bacterium]
MTTRRIFLAGAAAIGAASLAQPAFAQIHRARIQGSCIRTKDGTDIYVKDWGSGPAVVLSHGWPFHADSWDFHAAKLVEAGYRVVSFDRRGFGRSSQPGWGYDFNTFADDLDLVMRSADVWNATLVGFSMGGGEVVRYVTRHNAKSKRVKKLVIIGGAATLLLKTPDNPNGMDASAFQSIKDGVAADRPGFFSTFLRDVFYDAANAKTHKVTPEIIDWSVDMAMEAGLLPTLACVDAFSKEDFRPELSSISIPTLLIHGTADIPVPIDISARYAAKAIKDAKLIEYEGASHGILVTERTR